MLKDKKQVIIPILLASFFAFIILLQAEFILASDDGRYSVSLYNKDLDLLKINNRVLINLVIMLIEACGIHFWKFCNLIIGIFLFLYLIKIALLLSQSKPLMSLNICFLSLIFFIPIQVLSSGMFWATGSFNYLWGCTGCLLFLYPFLCKLYEREINTAEFFLAIIGGIYAGNLEQTSAIQFCFSSAIIGYLIKKKIEKRYGFLYIIALLSGLLIMFLPFNKMRSYEAVALYFPEFNRLSIFDKLFLGVVNLYSHLINKAHLIMFFLSSTIFLLMVKQKGNSTILSLIPFTYFGGNLLIKSGYFLDDTIHIMYDFSIFQLESVMGTTQMFPVIIMTFCIGVEAYLLLILSGKNTTGLCVILFYFAGLASGLVMGFSPTIFASGNRVFFVLDIFIVLIIGILLYKNTKDEAIYSYVALGMCLLLLLFSIKLYFFCKGRILY